MVADWMGEATLISEKSKVHALDSEGPVSWLSLLRGSPTGSWSELESVEPATSGLIFRYRDGWTVLCPPGGKPRPLAA